MIVNSKHTRDYNTYVTCIFNGSKQVNLKQRFVGESSSGSEPTCVYDHRWPFSILRRPSISRIICFGLTPHATFLHHAVTASGRAERVGLSRCVCLCHPAALSPGRHLSRCITEGLWLEICNKLGNGSSLSEAEKHR